MIEVSRKSFEIDWPGGLKVAGFFFFLVREQHEHRNKSWGADKSLSFIDINVTIPQALLGIVDLFRGAVVHM